MAVVGVELETLVSELDALTQVDQRIYGSFKIVFFNNEIIASLYEL